LSFRQNGAKNLLAKSLVRHRDPTVLLFHRRAFDHRFASARLPGERGLIEFNRRDSMKYLLMIITTLAMIGTATATSRVADCCGGGRCCSGGHCCGK
jgi:hypothetical protein